MSIQRQFSGYNQSDFINNVDQISGISFFKLAKSNTQFNNFIPAGLRLGNRVEQFIFHQLEEIGFDIILKNFQVISDKLTIGEIDCIASKEKVTYHFEIVYKFYLYDNKVGTSKLDHWIGPNRKDSLVEKLDKLNSKQLPLLTHPILEQELKSRQLETKNIIQSVIFKAQLFTPFQSKNINFETINQNCVSGFYINFKKMDEFAKSKFFIPEKLDWLIDCHEDKEWIAIAEFKKAIVKFIKNDKSPLCWIKNEDGTMCKFFVTWW